MTEPLGTRYEHSKTEEKIYKLWEESGYFNPDNIDKGQRAKGYKPFAIIMPPPNANGALHVGHAVGTTLQDILIRFWRMRGRRTLWLPGADHAGFETQVVFDKKLEKEGRSRFTTPREKLWQEMWEFTEANKKIMYGQLKKLGASCDWSREKFTLDPDIIKGVYATFEKLYKDGLAYRDLRIVNWCPKHKTALSDLEVKYVEREDPLYFIKYGPLTLATVRPETKFGDTALAVNPKDKRYQKYIGKVIEARGIFGPLKFKVIADEAVDLEFGTGVVKVTPAHDPNDFEIWQRHKNEIPGPKVVIDENGRLTDETGEFKGLKVAEARERVAEAMKKIGILEKVDPRYKHQVATCYKCGNTLEPLPRLQWFIRAQPLAKKAIEAVKSGKIKIHPAHSKKIYLHWLENIRDWNISRQIVWGIRIPAFYCVGCGEPKIDPPIKARWFLVRHGETDFNKERRTQGQMQVPLNEDGKKQAEQAAELLKNKNIDLVISSDLERCRQTAEIIVEKIGVEIIFDPYLREKKMGEVEGKLVDEWKPKYPDLTYDYHSKLPGGESFAELEKRVWETFKNHKNNHAHKNVVIVTHGGPIRTLFGKLKGWDFETMASHRVKNTEILELAVGEQCKKCGTDLYEQDPDVFDTWFSSGEWPFLALGYPDHKDFKTFYPTDVMETGYDILFFWVARMVMLSLYRTGKIPFKTVYLHGLVRDKDKQKMSKSKGNVVDPLGIAETYGTDALRMALVVGNTPGNDIAITEEKIRGYRNFTTKIWNVSRFILMNKPGASEKTSSKLTAEDKKNLAELQKIKTRITKHLEKFEFHLAAETAYHYFWHTFADKIIEDYKPRLRGSAAAGVLEEALGGPASSASEGFAGPRAQVGGRRRSDRTVGSEGTPAAAEAAYQTLESILLECLKMLHPFMPFVTEEIFQKFCHGKILMVEKW